MRRYLLWAAAALLAVIVLLAILPFVIPAGAWRATIERSAASATGRTLTIAGPMRLTVFPRLGIAAENVRFANMAGGQSPEMAVLGALRVSVDLLSLLTGEIRVSTVTLEKPLIQLEVDRNGRSNWTFGQSGAGAGGGLPRGLSFSGIAVSDGSISYTNAQTGKSLVIGDLDLVVAVTRLDAPASMSGHFLRAGKRVDFSGSITTLQSLSAGAATGLDLSLKSELLQAVMQGNLAPDHSYAGGLTAETVSVRRLGAWLGADMPAGGGLGKLILSAKLSYKPGLAGLDDLKLKLDGMTVSGALVIATTGARPRLSGQLAVDRLDLNPYLQTGAAEPAGSGWSKKPIAFESLRQFDADLSLGAGSLAVRKLAIGRTSLRASISNGVLHADLDRMALYGGSGHATLDIDAGSRTLRNNLDFSNVAMARLLGDTIGVSRVEGTGRIVLNVASRGDSADAVMRALSGKGAIAISNGKIHGVNLGLVATTVKSVLSGGATGDAASTQFSVLGGSFTIASGVLTSRDFKLEGPVFTSGGKGSLDVGNQTIDFLLMPKADIAVANLTVPFRVSGPWGHPRYLPDLAAMASGAMRGLANGSTSAAGLLGGILGGGKPSTGSGKPSGGLLGGLLGGR